ncbi:tRNA 2-thiouridine(34) synthase MnmA [bacterium]|nr:MAG: tRNA 2-thiouridine(34) synthase MnmA [bacterium]
MTGKVKVVVAMSGGVDSSVAAALLQRQGYEVIGITMCFGLKETNKRRPSCCGIEGIDDARRVAHKLGIKHYVLNFDKFLREKVIKNFILEYLSGRTPNPCIRCNEYLKFDALLNKAKSLGAGYLATGHYAKIARGPKYLLQKAKDKWKDQSYFLYRLNQKQLKHILFPLGNYTKSQVRELARQFDLPVKDKPGSQEICFIPDDDYRGFLRQELTRIKAGISADVKPGPILDSEGNILGEHKGIPFYTIGQREGLGVALGYPAYVIGINAKNNTIVLGKREEVLSGGLIAGDLSFIDKPIKRKVVLKVKIRYNHKEIASKAMAFSGNRIKIIFSKPQFAVTPGQSAVFYNGRQVVGGGIIETGLNNAELK